MQTAGEEIMTEDQAKEEYEKSEKSMRYQLIEGKLIEEYKLIFEIIYGIKKSHMKLHHNIKLHL